VPKLAEAPAFDLKKLSGTSKEKVRPSKPKLPPPLASTPEPVASSSRPPKVKRKLAESESEEEVPKKKKTKGESVC
jgi:hypothetical protein